MLKISDIIYLKKKYQGERASDLTSLSFLFLFRSFLGMDNVRGFVSCWVVVWGLLVSWEILSLCSWAAVKF